jgi:hypothetical protein
MGTGDFGHFAQGAAVMTTVNQLNFAELDGLVDEVKAIAQDAVTQGTAIHIVEKQLLEKLLQVGHAALGAMFQSVRERVMLVKHLRIQIIPSH